MNIGFEDIYDMYKNVGDSVFTDILEINKKIFEKYKSDIKEAFEYQYELDETYAENLFIILIRIYTKHNKKTPSKRINIDIYDLEIFIKDKYPLMSILSEYLTNSDAEAEFVYLVTNDYLNMYETFKKDQSKRYDNIYKLRKIIKNI